MSNPRHEGDRRYVWTPVDSAANYIGFVEADDLENITQEELTEMFSDYIDSGVVRSKIEDGITYIWEEDLAPLLFAETERLSGKPIKSVLVDDSRKLEVKKVLDKHWKAKGGPPKGLPSRKVDK